MAAANDPTGLSAQEYELFCDRDERYARVAEILSVPNALILGRIVVRVEAKSGDGTTTALGTTRKTARRPQRTTRKSRRK